MAAVGAAGSGGLNVLIEYAYDGTRYFGSQVQPGKPTVSGVINEALSGLYGRRISIDPASRTDRGVHARHTGATVLLPLGCGPDIEALVGVLNSRLPRDIRNLCARAVDFSASARYMARGREYRYRWRERREPDVFEARFRAFVPGRLDRDKMSEAARLFEGLHSFENFAKRRAGQVDFLCRIGLSEVRFDGTRGEFRIRGDRFLHQMVRRLQASMIRIGLGELEISSLQAAFDEGKPLSRVDVAAPEGLILWKVYFSGTN